ncbi:thioredoxin-like protein [Entophlyctis helioformis]|nr:thioredoxin-like protein [Entophlyctis helioformis]
MGDVQDTEWNDVLRAKGILPQKEAEITEEQVLELLEQSINEHRNGKALEDRSLDELDELEDLEDDRILESYRRQRLADMRAQLSLEKYGRVYQISKPDYTVQVTDASKTSWVIVHLFQDYLPQCKLLNAILDRLADKYKATKFCKIVADLCIPNYPDRNVPTILVYTNGDLRRQIMGMGDFGGAGATVASVEMYFKAMGAFEGAEASKSGSGSRRNDDEDNDVDDDDEHGGGRSGIRTGFSRVDKGSRGNGGDDDDDDWN